MFILRMLGLLICALEILWITSSGQNPSCSGLSRLPRVSSNQREDWREPRAKEHEQSARDNAKEIGNDSQTWNADQRGQILRCKDELDRSRAITRKESSSWVTFMVPISAAKADPDRPLTVIAVSNGPSSRVKPTATSSMT